MRLMILVQNYPPERGPVRYTSTLAAGLSARGHSVRVVTGLPHYPEGNPHPGFGSWKPSLRVEGDVRVVRTPLVMGGNNQLLRRLLGMVSFPVTALPAALVGRRPDVVIASAPPLPVCALGMATARAHRAPLVMLLRDVEPQSTLDMRGLSHRRWAQHAMDLTGRLYTAADRIVVVHESQVAALTGHGVPAAKVSTIRHGIDLDAFDRAARSPGAPNLRRPGRALALYTGTIGVAHDVDAVARLFASPEVDSTGFDLAIVGDGELRTRCERVIRERGTGNVQLYPPVALEHVPALLAQADLLVSSYRTTGREISGMIGSKLYEYFAAGRPVLVHGAGLAADMVRKAGNGWVIPARDAPALIRVLRESIADPSLVREMGSRGRAYAGAHFALAARYDQWEALLEEQLRKSP